MKSICIKTNNKNFIYSLLENLENCSTSNLYYSYRTFKHYKNIIIHYTSTNTNDFLSNIASCISTSIINCYEKSISLNILKSNYFYFSELELYNIHNLCTSSLSTDDFYYKKSIITSALFDYFINNKSANLEGFINFRLNNYIKYLDSIVDLAVNKFLIEKEYTEYINLLKLYINTQNSNCKALHLIYQKENSVILDQDHNSISINKKSLTGKYLSDISFNENDYILDFLLSNNPNKLYIHLLNKEDEFITTLKKIFNNKVEICKDCRVCSLFKSTSRHL